jgi:hypothetical protein
VQLPKDDPPSRAGKGDQQAMGDYGLTVEVRHEPGHVLVTVAGEVDIATVAACSPSPAWTARYRSPAL